MLLLFRSWRLLWISGKAQTQRLLDPSCPGNPKLYLCKPQVSRSPPLLCSPSAQRPHPSVASESLTLGQTGGQVRSRHTNPHVPSSSPGTSPGGCLPARLVPAQLRREAQGSPRNQVHLPLRWALPT